MKEFIRRTIATLIGGISVYFLIAYADLPFVQFLVIIATTTIGCIAIWEYCQIAKTKEIAVPVKMLICFGLLEILSFYFSTQISTIQTLPILFFFLALLAIFVWHFRSAAGALRSIAVSTFGLIYIAVPMGMIFWILYAPHLYPAEGKFWLAYLIIVTKMTDMGGYFAGKLLGRRKLAASVSPGKTIEGAVLGFFTAIVASICFVLVSEGFCPDCFRLDISYAIGLGAIIGIIGQIGDLAESVLKRDAKKKDSNKLPGLGGMLDMLDSLLFNIPIIYFFLNLMR